MSIKRSIITSKPKKEILKVLKGIGITKYSLKKLKNRKIKISVDANLETCRKIINYLED
jgi:hypothetical protein